MLSRNHEMSGFAVGVTVASALGASAVGSLGWGLVAALSADLPDIDSPRARIVKMLCLVPYRVPSLDKNGDQRRGKPKPLRARASARGRTRSGAKKTAKARARRKLFWMSVRRSVGRWLLGVFLGAPEPAGELLWIWRTFPGHQLHRLSVRASEALYDRCATDADRRDTVPHQGCRFRSHRGLTHSLWACLVVGFLAWILGETIGMIVGPSVGVLGENVGMVLGAHPAVMLGVIVFTGMLTHILGDGCTDAGVSLLAPLVLWKGRRYPVQGLLLEPFRFKTGKEVENGPITLVCTTMALAAVMGAFGVLGPLLRMLDQVWSQLG